MIRSITRTTPHLGLAAIVLFALLTGLTARITIPLPFTVVPITLQTLAVLLSGLVLGSRGGAISQLAYLGILFAGLPLSSSGLGGPAAFLTPTGGYLVAFVPAAYVAGYLAERAATGATRALLVDIAAGITGMLVIYLGGVAWLSILLGDFVTALQQGLLPFIGVDLAKAVVAALVANGGRRILRPTS